MNVFQELLTKTFEEKRALLKTLQKPRTSSSVKVSTTESSEQTVGQDPSSASASAPGTGLDYSTSKVIRLMKDFEEERRKKKQKAFKESAPV